MKLVAHSTAIGRTQLKGVPEKLVRYLETGAPTHSLCTKRIIRNIVVVFVHKWLKSL
jgi:hypothetical protein